MGEVRRARVSLELLEAAPVLDQGYAGPAEVLTHVKQAEFGSGAEFLEHPRHAGQERQHHVELPRPVDPGSNDEDDEGTFDLCAHTALDDFGHAILLVGPWTSGGLTEYCIHAKRQRRRPSRGPPWRDRHVSPLTCLIRHLATCVRGRTGPA